MESEECVPAAVPPPPPPLLQQNPTTGRNRKRGGSGLMSSTVEAQVASHLPHHHDKVLRSHTRRGRGAGPVPSVVVPPPISISTSGGISRRKQRSSCCSSHTDEDDGGGSGGGEYGEVSVSLLNFGEERGKVEASDASENNSSSIIPATTISNSNKAVIERRAGGEQAVIIPSSTSCFAPTNETKELCEQAGLLGGPTKTTTIHSGGTRLSSLCIPPHNDLATQQCRNNNAGEHSSSSNNSNDNVKNSSQKIIAQGIAATAADNSAPQSRRRSRQHGHHHRERSTPPASAAADDADDDAQGNNVRRGSRGESGDDDNDEMCGEDAASCELPGKPNAAQQIQSSSPLTLSSSSVAVGASLSSAVTTSAGAETQVKSEREVGENGGKEKEGKNLTPPNKRGAKEQLKQYITEREEQLRNCERVHVKREVGEISVNARDLSGGAGGGGGGVGALKVNKIGGHDGGWSAGEDARQAEDNKDGAKVEKKIFSSTSSSPSWSSVGSSGCVSMPQKAGVKGSIQEDGSNCAAGKEQSKQSKSAASSTSGGASFRCVKKCASGGSKRQTASASQQAFNNNNNISSSGAAQSVGKSADRKKAPVPAPMLLMNNLPYMGELTFDTRPRRGRKPKKADICHLISKNYGIQFPAGVTQATLNACSLPIIAKSAQASASLSSTSKKTAETVSVSSKNNVFSSPRSLVPPTFCNRDVSIVPIIPTTWGSGSGCSSPLSLPISSDSSSKCSPSSSNLLKPLSSQLMLHHHQNPANSSASSTRSMASITSSPHQAISMFPLPTPSSFSQTHHTTTVSRANSNSKRSKTCDRETDYNAGEDEEENMMEVDIESHGGGGDGDDEDNQDSPLNLCMRDKSMLHRPHEPLSLLKDESLDVRWNRSGSGGKGSGASKGVVRTSNNNNINVNSYSCSDGAIREGGSSKRSMMQSSSANPMMKGGKSAKIAGTTSRPPSSLNFSLVNSSTGNNISISDSDNVSNLVSCRPSPSPSSSPFGNVQQSSKLSPNIFAISAHHLQSQGLENTGKASGGGKGKQGAQSRKKREVNLRGDISISAAGSPGSSGGPTPLSSIGGTLFGQSTAGINDGAEVSICKFKFTGGAKPCLQEKKMLSVDSGGNFRFYSDKTTGTGGGSGTGTTGKLSGKGQQQQLPLSSASGCSNNMYSTTGRTDMSQSPPSTGDGIECHYALSSLPKSAKSMSMCMPQGAVSNSGIQVQMSSSTTTSAVSTKGKGSSASKLSLPLSAASSSSGAAAANPYASLSISPTAEELQQLHLSMHDQGQQGRSSSRVSPFPSGGDYSYSSSNSCSSSDNCFGGDVPSSSSVKSNRQTSSSHSHNYRGSGSSSGKMKLKRKRRTRKSLMREKLEKTFKEKGFLIQTQQLESAEGATYCKFRQLRKFTRYLFRSWKDYLPDHVKEISDNNPNNNNDGAMPGSEQALPNSQQASNSTGQTGESSNVQSIADEEAEGDVDDEEDDGDEDYEVDSEEHLRQSLISHSSAIVNDDEDEESDDDEVDDEDRVTQQRGVFKGGNLKRKEKHSSAAASVPEVKKLDSGDREDADSSKDDDNEDVELQVDS